MEDETKVVGPEPSFVSMNKALTEMSDEEILDEINRLRDRRRAARERRASEHSAAEASTKKRPSNEVTGALGSALDAIFADDAELCPKCSKPMLEGACGNLACE